MCLCVCVGRMCGCVCERFFVRVYAFVVKAEDRLHSLRPATLWLPRHASTGSNPPLPRPFFPSRKPLCNSRQRAPGNRSAVPWQPSRAWLPASRDSLRRRLAGRRPSTLRNWRVLNCPKRRPPHERNSFVMLARHGLSPFPSAPVRSGPRASERRRGNRRVS